MTDAAPPKLHPDHALFLDFDGTLAPIEDDPRAVALPDDVGPALERAARFLGGAAAIISGRDIRDLDLRAPRSVMRIGAHGLEIAEAGAAPGAAPQRGPRGLAEALGDIAARRPEVWIEEKGPVFAIHFRRAPSLEGEIRAEAEALARRFPDYVTQAGKMIVEMKPKSANKGKSIERLMARAPFAGRIPVMAGDDATDEDAFAVVERLGGITIKVGPGPTRARYRLADPHALARWLIEATRPEEKEGRHA
ncbi:MAG: trehalose-phosphatase [Alphaproteobacteria bacterium]|nr:trehalose-phosphatase [Alphaproteobacteria bacterium]